MAVSFGHRGSFDNLESFLKTMRKTDINRLLHKHAQEGVNALVSATPLRSGLAASSWGYEIVHTGTSIVIAWTNDNVENGHHVAVMIQYGHGTGTGGYVVGRDYINPAIRPVFDSIADGIWEAVTSA